MFFFNFITCQVNGTHNTAKRIIFTDGTTCVIHSPSKFRTTKKRKLNGMVCQVVNQQRVNEVWAALACYLLHMTASSYALLTYPIVHH
jgi:hypothetical protein